MRTVDAQLTGYVTKDFGFVHADLNAGLNVWRLDARDGPALAQGMAALALTASLPAPFGVMAEMYAFSDAQPVTAKDSGVLFACTHAARPWLVFDLGGDVGLFPGSRSYSAFLGMSIIPAVLWRP